MLRRTALAAELCRSLLTGDRMISPGLSLLFALAFALGVGLPAFGVLARRLDDPDVPAMMRPLPARVLTACILALAMAGSLSW